MGKLALSVGLGLLLTAGAFAAGAQQDATGGNPRAGRVFALQTCTPCHVVSSRQSAPRRFADAPDFQAIANTKGTTAMSLQVFLFAPHPTMPNLILSPDEASNVIAYILSLRDRR